MKICLPAYADEGMQSILAPNFGAAPWLLVFDSDGKPLESIDRQDIAAQDREIHMDLIMCRGMTELLYASLRGQGVPIYGTTARTVEGALADYARGDLVDLLDMSCCHGSRADCDSGHEIEIANVMED